MSRPKAVGPRPEGRKQKAKKPNRRTRLMSACSADQPDQRPAALPRHLASPCLGLRAYFRQRHDRKRLCRSNRRERSRRRACRAWPCNGPASRAVLAGRRAPPRPPPPPPPRPAPAPRPGGSAPAAGGGGGAGSSVRFHATRRRPAALLISICRTRRPFESLIRIDQPRVGREILTHVIRERRAVRRVIGRPVARRPRAAGRAPGTGTRDAAGTAALPRASVCALTSRSAL